MHGATAMIFLAVVLALLAVLMRSRSTAVMYRRVTLLLVVLVAQAAIGYVQYFTDVPRGLVALHVAGAVAVFSAAMGVLLACRVDPTAPRVQRV